MADKNKIIEAFKNEKGAVDIIASLIDDVEDLKARLKALESAEPLTAQVSITEPRSVTDVLKAEHDSIAKDPAPHIAQRMEFGLSEKQATDAVSGRKVHLARELGIGAKAVRTVIKKAAAALIMLACMLGLTDAVRADSQGLGQTYLTSTNLPVWPSGGLAGGTAVFYSLNSTATNYIALRANSGLGVEYIWGATNATTTGSSTVWFYPSVDGINAQTVAPFAILASSTNSVNGTNVVIATTNWSQLQLRGYAGFFYTVSNGCNNGIIVGGSLTNLQNGVTNVYPAGLTFNRPNQ